MNTSISTSRYIAPVNGPYKAWDGCECEDYEPNDRQKIVIEAVQSALDAKLFYTDDVLAHCKVFLGVTQDQAVLNTNISRVEGGDFGMECYYARNFIKAQIDHEKNRVSLARLQPHVKQVLGTLVFNDFKRNTGVIITDISEGGKAIEIVGKRGAFQVKMSCTARQIENAINRAFEKKFRKDDFELFIASMNAKSTLL